MYYYKKKSCKEIVGNISKRSKFWKHEKKNNREESLFEIIFTIIKTDYVPVKILKKLYARLSLHYT